MACMALHGSAWFLYVHGRPVLVLHVQVPKFRKTGPRNPTGPPPFTVLCAGCWVLSAGCCELCAVCCPAILSAPLKRGWTTIH